MVISHRQKNYYVQFSLIDSTLVVEAVSNVFLDAADQLTHKQHEQLITLGWHAPAPDGNFHAHFTPPSPQLLPTYMMLRALRDVYNIS